MGIGFETPPQHSGLVSRRNSSVGSGGSHSGSSWSMERPLLHRSSSAILGSGADKISPLVLPYADDSDSSLSLDDRSNDSYDSSKTHNDKKQQKQQHVAPWACTLSAAFLLHVTGLVHGVWTYRDGVVVGVDPGCHGVGDRRPLFAALAATTGLLDDRSSLAVLAAANVQQQQYKVRWQRVSHPGTRTGLCAD